MFADLLDLLWPVQCAGCGAHGRPLCTSCCPSGPVQLRNVGQLQVASAGIYDGALRDALLAYKERGRTELRRPLGSLVARSTEAFPRALLVPVPTTKAAIRARGHDHVRTLALAASGAVRPALRLVRAVADSSGLTIEERARNLAGAMQARPPPIPGIRCIVVDDIVTTGATLLEARRALSAARWEVVGAVTVAGTVRRGLRADSSRSWPIVPGGRSHSGLA